MEVEFIKGKTGKLKLLLPNSLRNMIRVKVDFNFNYKYSLLDWFNGHHQGLARMQNAQTQNGQFV